MATPVPQKATYWAYMIEWAGYINQWLINNNSPPYNDGGLAMVYYDGEMGAYRLVDQTGDYAGYESFINNTFNAYTTYYVHPANGSVQGFRNFTEGELQDVIRNQNATRAASSLSAINKQLLNGSYVATGDCTDTALSRECAYALLTHINAIRAGIVLTGPQTTRMNQLISWCFGHIQQWAVTFTAPYFRPFMGALTAQALIYKDIYIASDPVIATQLKVLADYAWTSCWKGVSGPWGQANSFLYTDRTGFNSDDPFVQPDLNMLIAPWWGYLYYVGKGASYRTNGDLIFQGGLPVYNGQFPSSGTYLGTRSALNPSGKQYFQQLYWGPRYIEWAEAATSGTAYTSSTAGNWSIATNWTPNGVPGEGDSVTIASGANITVNTPQVIGTSLAAGTVVVTVNSGATLTIADGASLRMRGDGLTKGTGIIVNAGGSGFFFDHSLAPSGTKYKMQLGNANGNNARWLMQGTASKRVLISSEPTAGLNGWITDDGASTETGLVQATYTDFNNIGDDVNPAIRTSPTGSTSFILSNCTFASCGPIKQFYNIGANATYQIKNTTFTDSLDASVVGVRLATGAPIGTGTRELLDNTFDFRILLYPGENFTVNRNLFMQGLECTTGKLTEFKNNFVRFTATKPGPLSLDGDIDTVYFYYDNISDYNPHFIQPLAFARNQLITGCIFDMNCASTIPKQEGDCFTFATPGSACVATIKNNLVLMGPNNKTIGTLFTMLGNANTSVICEHNTCYTGDQGAAVGESYAGFTGMVQSFKSNLMWNNLVGEGYKLYSLVQTVISNIVTAANCNYNGAWNLLTGNNTKNYNNLLFSSPPPGVNDRSGDPLFIDYTRNLRSFSTASGGNGTDTNAYSILISDPAVKLPALISYIQDGFHPQNTTYKTTAHDGGDIGAVSVLTVISFMTASPNSVYANSTGNIIVLTGTGTNWTAGTPGSPIFTVSDVAGAAITSQTITSPTSATITLTGSTGGAIGVITISDGIITTPVTVLTPPPGVTGVNARRRAF